MTGRGGEEDLLFSKTAMDCTGIMMPGLDLPHLTTLEEEWRYGPDSQHGHLANQIGKRQESGEMYSYLTHLLSPVYSAQDSGFQN